MKIQLLSALIGAASLGVVLLTVSAFQASGTRGPVAGLGVATGDTSTEAPQESDFSTRLRSLEDWRSAAEARIQTLEGVIKTEGSPAALEPAAAAERVLIVKVSNKRFDPSDIHNGKFEDNIWWDAEYTGAGLEKPARSIKGVLKFCDLFGDSRFQVRVTIDDPIKPGAKLKTKGVGIEYNQFIDQHKWLRATDLDNMTVKFEVESILYEDGTTERFGN